jgi:hypothetical protein
MPWLILLKIHPSLLHSLLALRQQPKPSKCSK